MLFPDNVTIIVFREFTCISKNSNYSEGLTRLIRVPVQPSIKYSGSYTI